MKKIILTVIVVILTILNIFLFRAFYKSSYNTNNLEKENKISQKYLQIDLKVI